MVVVRSWGSELLFNGHRNSLLRELWGWMLVMDAQRHLIPVNWTHRNDSYGKFCYFFLMGKKKESRVKKLEVGAEEESVRNENPKSTCFQILSSF